MSKKAVVSLAVIVLLGAGRPALADEKKQSPEEKVKRMGLVRIREIRDGISTKPTPQAPKPPVIHFFKGEKSEVRVAPGQSALVELPKPGKELAWEIPGYAPEAVGDEGDDEFEFVLCQWDARVKTNLVFTLYRRPAKGEKGDSPPVFPVLIAEETPEAKADRIRCEAKVKSLKLVETLTSTSFVDPAPTARIPKPVIVFFKDQKSEVQLAPGRTVLIELPKPAKELVWSIGEEMPRSAPGLAGTNVKIDAAFEFVVCRWEKHGDVTITMYQRPSLPEHEPK